MHSRGKHALAGGLVALALGGGTGAALAASGSASGSGSESAARTDVVLSVGGGTGVALAASGSASEAGPPGVVVTAGPGPFAAAADYLGLTRQQVLDALASGKSLAQMAAEQGKSVDGLKAALVEDAKAKLDQAVADGKLTSAEESQMLSDLTSRIGDLVNATGLPPGPHAGTVLRVGPPAAIADYLGLTQDELRTQLEAGKSLAAVAEAQGKSVEGLEAAMLADAKAHLDAAVAAGEISADREQQMLDELKSRLDEIVNRTGPPPGPAVTVPA